MKFKILLYIFCLLNATHCKESKNISIEESGSFNVDLEEGCKSVTNYYDKQNNSKCEMQKELLFCYNLFHKANSSLIDQIFYKTKWSDSEQESKRYFWDQRGKVTLLEGGPADMEKDYEIIGQGKIYKENTGWVYEQTCKPGKCEDLKFSIEYISCDASFHPSDRDYHLSVTIGNRHYDFLEPNNKEKHVSLEYDGIIKPQIRNGFELYLVPPPVK
ncbi:hypothetical protein [Leptospira terpstrae]|uniref:Uncharacterized protein n=1 Tax=Leptospira terpstrae serovar Hualin str. LT 11-33 = ATCC 700639 TaxID=1257025 RepID=N1VV07_9LEPT|nr:hypothetical protein [Leptospira terpstrae]EMY62288.1 hypothetical protein LEP1GSC203_2306 [Leptospira terpstrae serovar Hualin str. LT 11-33 = ATCC 700639]